MECSGNRPGPCPRRQGLSTPARWGPKPRCADALRQTTTSFAHGARPRPDGRPNDFSARYSAYVPSVSTVHQTRRFPGPRSGEEAGPLIIDRRTWHVGCSHWSHGKGCVSKQFFHDVRGQRLPLEVHGFSSREGPGRCVDVEDLDKASATARGCRVACSMPKNLSYSSTRSNTTSLDMQGSQ